MSARAQVRESCERESVGTRPRQRETDVFRATDAFPLPALFLPFPLSLNNTNACAYSIACVLVCVCLCACACACACARVRVRVGHKSLHRDIRQRDIGQRDIRQKATRYKATGQRRFNLSAAEVFSTPLTPLDHCIIRVGARDSSWRFRHRCWSQRLPWLRCVCVCVCVCLCTCV